jgi:uncharacterized protein
MKDEGRAGAGFQPFSVGLTFHGDLRVFLRRWARTQPLERRLKERTSVKDIIESCGVPHTEVDAIRCDNEELSFSHIIDNNISIDVYPVGFIGFPLFTTHLQIRDIDRFVADVHLGRLTQNLRLLGVDVTAPQAANDRHLLDVMVQEKRALLTRDRRLLMHSVVRTGFHPRSQNPAEQTIEVLRRFDLLTRLAPFTRCIHCNELLEAVTKSEIIKQLEPLTRQYYDDFRRCRGCGRIYWRGSHFDKLLHRVEEFRSKAAV